MEEFISTYTPYIWAVGVILSVLLLRVCTNFLHKWLVKKESEKFPDEKTTPVDLIRRILNALWLVLGLIALSFLFVERDKDQYIISKFNLVLYIGVLAVFTIVAAASTNMWFKKSIKLKVANSEDPTSYKFLRYVAVFSIYFIGILFTLLAFPSLRGVAQTALGGAGVLAIVLGVASQEALANLVGGIFIISFKPFKIGDLVKVTDTMIGTVTDITLRHTVIRNFENKMIVIPNSIINKEKLINYDLGEKKCCERIEIGISYDSNVILAKQIMQSEAEKHPLLLDNRTYLDIENNVPKVRTALISIDESSVTIRVWTWAKNFNDAFNMRCDLLESIKKRFEDEGIDMPYPHRTVVFAKGNKLTISDDAENNEN